MVLPDVFIDHDKPERMYAQAGLDSGGDHRQGLRGSAAGRGRAENAARLNAPARRGWKPRGGIPRLGPQTDDKGFPPVSAELVAVAALAIWLYLLLARGFFWRAAERDDALGRRAARRHLAVRDGDRPRPQRGRRHRRKRRLAACARPIPGRFRVVLVDDESTDGTADVARGRGRSAAGAADRLTVLCRHRAARRLDRQALGARQRPSPRRDAGRARPTSCSSPTPTSPTARPTRCAGWSRARSRAARC